MRVLIATRKERSASEDDRARECLRTLRGAGNEHGHEVVVDWDLDWQQMHEVYGSVDRTYAALVDLFDALVVVEDDDQLVARGQFAIASEMLLGRRRVFAWRDGASVAIRDLDRIAGAPWKQGYGRLRAYTGGEDHAG